MNRSHTQGAPPLPWQGGRPGGPRGFCGADLTDQDNNKKSARFTTTNDTQSNDTQTNDASSRRAAWASK
jgi:hypothetical protein